MSTNNNDKKSKPINIPKKIITNNTNFNEFENYYYKSPEECNKKKKDELYIERFLYMRDNMDPNFPKFNSPPITDSFKRKYLEKIANKVLIN
jgi:hypothetical protein